MGLFADRDQEIEAWATGHVREIPNQDEDLGDDGRVNLEGLVVVPVLPLLTICSCHMKGKRSS